MVDKKTVTPSEPESENHQPAQIIKKRRHLSIKQAALFGAVFAVVSGFAVWRSLAAPIAPDSYAPAVQVDQNTFKSQVKASPQFSAKLNQPTVKIVKASKQINQDTGHETLEAITIDYSTGITERTSLDVVTGKLSSEKLDGHPQSSTEERDQAVNIIEASPTIAPLLANGQHLSGGFVVDPPGKGPVNQRVLQYKLMSSDRESITYVILVDLTAKKVLSIKAPAIKEASEEH